MTPSKGVVLRDVGVRVPHPALSVEAPILAVMPHIRSLETVSAALLRSDEGMPDAANAALTGVAVKTIRRWRRLYQRRGLARGQSQPVTPCPRCTDAPLAEDAYALLLGWYLGDGHLVRCRGEVWQLSIFNDARYTALNQEIADTMRKVKPGSSPNTRNHPGSVETKVCWKHWLCLFPQHGPGKKHTRAIVLTDWQQDIVRSHPRPFVRGLLCSDGCRSLNTIRHNRRAVQRTYSYPRYFFTNTSTDIRELCCWALDLLGVPWRRMNDTTISVARREGVAALDAFVGPKH